MLIREMITIKRLSQARKGNFKKKMKKMKKNETMRLIWCFD